MLLAVGAVLLVVIASGRTLEDACSTEPPPDFAPEFTAVRGPIREGLVTFRCQPLGAPHTAYVFRDFTPMVGTILTALGVVLGMCLLWRWALRRTQPA